MVTFEEFKKTCFHTREYLKVPLCNTDINKYDYLMTDKQYDFEKEDKILRHLYEKNNIENR